MGSADRAAKVVSHLNRDNAQKVMLQLIIMREKKIHFNLLSCFETTFSYSNGFNNILCKKHI